MKRDLVCALALLIVAATYYFLARGLGQTALSDTVGPAGLPIVYAAVLGGLAVALAGSAVLRATLDTRVEGTAADASTVASARRLRRAAGALAIGIAYLVGVRYVGYLVATAVSVATMAIYQGEAISWRLMLVACIGAVVLFVLFDVVLGVDMPTPLWTAWRAA